MIQVKDFSHHYTSRDVVHQVSLEVARGDIYGFIGPNGAGKTTTIRFLATLLLPGSGQAWIKNIDVVKEPQQVRELIGYVPDQFGVYDGMKVREYLDFFAMAYGISRRERIKIVSDCLELVDLKEKSDAPANRLSRGMRQRLGLARALLHDPPVLLLDEPASGLDPRGRIEIMELLKELQAMGKTTLVSSHILNEIAGYCNKIGIIESGRMIAQGSLAEITRNLSDRRRIRLTVLDHADAAREYLYRYLCFGNIEHNGNTFYCDFTDPPAELPAHTARMIQEGIPVLYVQEQELSLEDVFMKLTKGNVQ